MAEKQRKTNSEPGEKWSLIGEICLGRRWVAKNSHPFSISFTALGSPHAKRIALQSIKAFVRREKKRVKASKFVLDGVFLVNGTRGFSLAPRYNNDSLLFVTQPGLVWIKDLVMAALPKKPAYKRRKKRRHSSVVTTQTTAKTA